MIQYKTITIFSHQNDKIEQISKYTVFKAKRKVICRKKECYRETRKYYINIIFITLLIYTWTTRTSCNISNRN